MSYTKLASSILTSTIWMEDDQTRIVWLTMLAMADKNGEVQASIPGLANVARVPVESCRLAIEKFMSPDADSRTKDDEGRRIEGIRGGWSLINHAEYRELASDDDRKCRAAERQQRARDKAKRNADVTSRHKSSRQIPQADAVCLDAAIAAVAVAPVVVESKRNVFQVPTYDEVEIYIDDKCPNVNPEVFYRFYESKNWMVGNSKMKNWQAAASKWQAEAKPKKKKEVPVSREERERIFLRDMHLPSDAPAGRD